MKKIIAFCLSLAVFACCLSSCKPASNTTESTHTITDMSGKTITLPNSIEKYAVVWTSIMDIAAMVDGYEHICAYSDISLKYDMVQHFYGQKLKQAVALPKENISVESIVQSGAEVVFLKTSDYKELATQLEKVSIPVIDMTFENYDELKKVVSLFAEVINTESAITKAQKYSQYVDKSLASMSTYLDNIQQKNTNTAVVFRDAIDFTAYGKNRMKGFWIEKCGFNYVVEQENNNNNINLTKEQLLEYNPDYIFFVFKGNKQKLLEVTELQSLSAIKNNHVYDIPIGFESYGVKGAESVLQLHWVMSTIYKEEPTTEIIGTILDFYKDFYSIQLTETEAKKIINNEG